jgi:hypothetical protein
VNRSLFGISEETALELAESERIEKEWGEEGDPGIRDYGQGQEWARFRDRGHKHHQ